MLLFTFFDNYRCLSQYFPEYIDKCIFPAVCTMAEKIGKCRIGEADEDDKLCNDEQGAFGRTEDSKKKKNRRKKRKPSAKDDVIF